MKTTTTWIKEHEFESAQNGHTVRLDGHVKNGMSPKALLLSGLAGCTAIDVVDILEKMRVKFSKLEVVSEAEQTTEHPKVFTHIDLTYSLHTDPANRDKIIKAIELSLEKYCGVAAMLRKNSPVNYKLVIV